MGKKEHGTARHVNKYEHLTQPEDTLDFHDRGVLTKQQIIQMTLDFIASAIKRKLKRVLIITGKGLHSAGGPVVGPVVRAVLQAHEDVQSVQTARRDRGGEGALEVML